MSGPKITLVIEGVERAVTALKLANENIGGRVRMTVRRTEEIVLAGAKARVAKRSGELAATIRGEVIGDGLIAIVKAGYGSLKRRSRSKSGKRRRSRAPQLGPTEPGIYAMVEEYGDQRNNKQAHPYMYPAVDARLPDHIAEIALDLRAGSEGLA